MPSTTDVIQVATGVASLAVSALALREARLQRVARDGSGPPPPAPAPHLPAEAAMALPPEPAPPPVAVPPPDLPPATVPSPRPTTAGTPPEAPGTVGPVSPWPPGSPPSGHAPPQGGSAHVWPGAPAGPVATRSRLWLPWAAVVGVAAVLVCLGGVALLAGGQDDPTASDGRADDARQSWPFASMALLVLTVVIALVLRARRAPSRVAWVAVPAVLAAASVAVIVFALPVHAAIKLGAVVAALGVAAWAAFRR